LLFKGAEIMNMSKDELVSLAKAHGWRGDYARTSKDELASWCASNIHGATVPTQNTLLPVETVPMTEAPKQSAAAITGDAAALIAAGIAAIAAQQTPQLDENAIRAIVRAEVQKMPTARLIVETAASTVTMEGVQHKAFRDVLRIVGTGLNLYMAGPAGSGKTTIAENAAKALGLRFYMSGAISAKHELLGFVDANSRIVPTPFREAWITGGLFLMDEVDASSPVALLALQAALANGHCEFPGCAEPVKRHPDFRCILSANTWGSGADMQYIGRAKLDAAFLDRFVFLPIDYDAELERICAGNDDWAAYVQAIRAAARQRGKLVVVSPRASIAGAKMLAAGFSRDEVKSLCLFNRMSQQDRTDLELAAGA
jgi:cobaltochelatase CobS